MRKLMAPLFLAFSFLSVNSPAQAQEAGPAVALPAWVSTTTVGGDLRYRLEEVTQESATIEDYKHQRIRARLGVKSEPAPGRVIEFRLATGAGRASTNQTLGAAANGSNNYDFKLDRASFKLALIDGLSLWGGRTSIPWSMALENDLVWDADMNFDGLALKAEHTFEPVTVFATLASHIMDKTVSGASDVDVQTQSAQLGAKTAVGETSQVALMLTGWSFEKIRGHAAFGALNGNTGVGAAYAYDYRVNSAGLEFSTKISEIPVAIGGEAIQNVGADKDRDGWLAGLKIGKPKKAGEMGLAYDFRTLDKDATVASFIDGDTLNGSTNGASHRATFNYVFAPGFGTALTWIDGYVKNAAEQKITRRRVQADLNFSF